MRTTLTLDDDLFNQAAQALGRAERSLIVHEALKALIEREAAKRLIRLGGSMPELARPARRRPRQRSV